MGNCAFQGGSSHNDMQWGGEDWSCLQSPRCDNTTTKAAKQKDSTPRTGKKVTRSQVVPTTTSTTRQIKVKITKKQLGELVEEITINNTDHQGKKNKLSVQEILDKLFKMSAEVKQETWNGVDRSTTSWKPRLQSIPERHDH